MTIYDGRESFYQWDLNQKITSNSFSVGDNLHFFNSKQTKALVVKAYKLNGKVVADVPNILLQSTFPIIVWRYTHNENAYQTVEKQTFDVQQRAQPNDYVYTETELYELRSAVDSLVTEANELLPELRVANANETERVASEIERVNDEAIRVNSESQRVTSEIARVKAEKERQSAETIRQTAFEQSYNNVANALKGVVSGEAIRVDDVSPIEHTMKLTIKSVNLFDVDSYEPDTNKLKFSTKHLELGKTYTLTSDIPLSWFKISNSGTGHSCVEQRDNVNGFTSFTFTHTRHKNIPESSNLYFYFDNMATTAVGNIEAIRAMNIRVVEGGLDKKYTPYIDPTTATVTRFGVDKTDNSQTYTPKEDGTCEVVSLSPTVTLLTDIEGVTIEAEYNRDINTVINDILKLINKETEG